MTHDIDTRDSLIADLSAKLEAAEAEVERLKGQLDLQECDTIFWKERAGKAAAQERAAIVAWLRSKTCGMRTLANRIERDEHGTPEGEKL